MATLVSVNVGMPRDVAWKGQTVYTGAWKQPVDGARMVRRLNVDGDGQGDLDGHGGENRAVLVYQLDSYRYWRNELGRSDLEPGAFGENFTVDELADDQVCIGDRYRIGELVVEVTQPRVTCYRVGMRLGEPRMAALLVQHHRPGFYCRVLAEGEARAGQPIVKVGEGPGHVTVAEIDALLYLPGHPRAGLRRALGVPALSPGWKASLRSLLEQGAGAQRVSGNSGLTGGHPATPAWPGFRALRVTATRAESRHVRSIVLGDAGGAPMPRWLAGQSIAVRLPLDSGATAPIRNYSLSNDPGAGSFRIGVKREDRGTVSGYIHEHLQVGDLVDVAAPRGTFVLDDGPDPVILLSAGVGVTPLLAMLHQLAGADSRRPVWWLHGARDGSEHAFATEAHELLSRLHTWQSRILYSRPAAGDRAGVDYTERGRLSAEELGRLPLPRDAHAYLCGPASFMKELGDALVRCGLAPGNIHTEIFGARAAITPGIAAVGPRSPHPPAGPRGSGPDVHFARSALSAPWRSGFDSLLDFAEACDVPSRWACRTGVCHTCETALLSGQVHYDVEPLDPPADGDVLMCIAKPTEAVVVDL